MTLFPRRLPTRLAALRRSRAATSSGGRGGRGICQFWRMGRAPLLITPANSLPSGPRRSRRSGTPPKVACGSPRSGHRSPRRGRTRDPPGPLPRHVQARLAPLGAADFPGAATAAAPRPRLPPLSAICPLHAAEPRHLPPERGDHAAKARSFGGATAPGREGEPVRGSVRGNALSEGPISL